MVLLNIISVNYYDFIFYFVCISSKNTLAKCHQWQALEVPDIGALESMI